MTLAVPSLEAAGIVFVATGAFYYFNVFGAGDSRLTTAAALFAGLGDVVEFARLIALAGTLTLASAAFPISWPLHAQAIHRADFPPPAPAHHRVATGRPDRKRTLVFHGEVDCFKSRRSSIRERERLRPFSRRTWPVPHRCVARLRC